MENQTNHTVLKEVDNSILLSFEGFVYEAIRHFNSLNRDNKDITIYMPSYFNEMLSAFWSSSPYNRKPAAYMNQFTGVKIVDGYEHKVIVAIKDGALHNIEPREMIIS